MAMPVKDYLLLYFRQKHFDGMPDPVRARFDEYAERDDFRGDMKTWKRDLLESDGVTNKPLPDAKKELDADGWESLFKSLQNAFIAMSANKESFKDNDDATKFLEEYFGDPKTKIFSLPEIDTLIIAPLNLFITTIIKDTDGFRRFDDIFDYDIDEYKSFVKALDKGKYKEDLNVRKKLNRIVSSIAGSLESGEIPESLATKLSSAGLTVDVLNNIINGLNKEAIVDPANLKRFKDEYQIILNTLHDKPKIYDVFKQYDNGKISTQLDEAIKKTDYTGKINEKDLVPEKRPDVKNLRQKYESWKKDTYKNYFRKYMTAHHDRIFFNQYAKMIFDALDDNDKGIKPTDGIDGILKNADITKKLQVKSPTAAAHFKWFTETMENLKETIPNAYKGALQNGHQMNRLVEEMALTAVNQVKDGTDKDAIKKAKTAMEILMVMRYGLFDSRTMDAINGMDFTIFSDKDLSWNRNEGIQFVTKAFDRTLKFGVQAVGYGITAAVNGIKRRGTKFKHSGRLQEKANEWEQENKQEKLTAEKLKRKRNGVDNAAKKVLQAHKNGLKAAMKKTLGKKTSDPFRLTEAEKYLRGERKKEDAQKAKTDAQETKMNTAKAHFDSEKAIDDDFKLLKDKEAAVIKQQAEVDKIEAELKLIPNPTPDQYQEALAQQKRQDWEKAKADLQKLSDDFSNATKETNDKYAAAGKVFVNEYMRIHTVPAGKTKTPLQEAEDAFKLEEHKFNIMDKTLKTMEGENNKLDQQISEYKEDTESISARNSNIKRRNEEFKKWDENHKNEYLELMAFWDYLQTGNTKNLFRISTKKVQQEMDEKQASGKTKMEEIYAKWKAEHSY